MTAPAADLARAPDPGGFLGPCSLGRAQESVKAPSQGRPTKGGQSAEPAATGEKRPRQLPQTVGESSRDGGRSGMLGPHHTTAGVFACLDTWCFRRHSRRSAHW